MLLFGIELVQVWQPSIFFLTLGSTHPNVKGESYPALILSCLTHKILFSLWLLGLFEFLFSSQFRLQVLTWNYLDCSIFQHNESWLFPLKGSGSDSFAANPFYKHQEQEANGEGLEEQNPIGLHARAADAECLPKPFNGQCWSCFGTSLLSPKDLVTWWFSPVLHYLYLSSNVHVLF